jgi:glutathione S-transferase
MSDANTMGLVPIDGRRGDAGDVILYHVPPSFYSQIGRLALTEKGVDWRGEIVAAGPPTFESYRPWYMRLNPNGTVPTLVHGDTVVPDSIGLARYADEAFEGPRLFPEDAAARQRVEAWLERIDQISVRELSYGSGRLRGPGHFVNQRRLGALRRQRAAHPELAEVYDAKIRDIAGFDEGAGDAAHVEALRRRVTETLDEMDKTLRDSTWLAGDEYSMADVAWTVGVARLHMLGVDPLAGRPALASWYARVKARPSFVEADVWERFRPGRMLRALAGKYTLAFVVLFGGLASALAALVWWLLR